MNLHFYLLLCASLISLAYLDDDLCGSVTKFDTVCHKNDLVYVISANPCINETGISLTVLDKATKKSTFKYTTTDINNPLPIESMPGKGIVLDMHVKPVLDLKEYRHTRLHVMLFMVDVKSFKTNSSTESMIVDTLFPMYSTCDEDTEVRNHTWGFRPLTPCDVNIRIGEYSTLCWVQAKKKSLPAGIYFNFFDTCTVPYSTKIMVIPDSGPVFTQAFTQDMTDTRMPVSAENNDCGLIVQMHDHYTLSYHIVLVYTCRFDNSTKIKLINDNYYTELSMICPLANCTTNSSNPLSQSCVVPWMKDNNIFRDTHITVTLNICKPLVEMKTQIYVRGDDDLTFTQVLTLVADHENELHDFGHAQNLHLESPFSNDCNSTTDGYMCLDKGLISLYAYEVKEVGLFHVSILRHYPSKFDAIPILHTEFWSRRQDVCHTSVSSSHSGVKIGVSITIVLVVLISITGGFCYWKRKQRSKGSGLPYEIHLGEQELDDVNY